MFEWSPSNIREIAEIKPIYKVFKVHVWNINKLFLIIIIVSSHNNHGCRDM